MAPLPAGAIRYTPSADYATWWAELESCSGRTGDLGTIRWYVVPSATTFTVKGREYWGMWYEEGNRIVLAENSTHIVGDIAHEMLHALLRRGDHPAEYFLEKCGTRVNCAGDYCNDS